MNQHEYNQSVDLYADNVYRFILKHARDTDLAKDMVQEAYAKLWEKVDEISFEKSKPWLFSTAYHKFIDWVRREKKNADFEIINEEDWSHEKQYSDLNEMLHAALETLPTIQKSVILLRDYEGYSYEEIGKITDLNESQVKVYIYRARLALKNYIGSLEVLI